MKFSIYEIVTFLSYLIAFLIYIFYGYKLSDTANPIHITTKSKYTYALLFIIYVPFLCCALSILYRNRTRQYNIFILSHFMIILFILTPLVMFKDDIVSINLTSTYSHKDLIDTVEYDNEGNVKNIQEGSPKTPDKTRVRASESEFNNRANLRRGLYD